MATVEIPSAIPATAFLHCIRKELQDGEFLDEVYSPTGSNDYRCYLHQRPCSKYQDDGSQLRLQT